MARRAVLAAVLVLTMTPPAYAGEGHSITATCDANARANVIPPSTYTAFAQAGGHVRPVSTSVECTVSHLETPRGTFGMSLPGPFAIAHLVTLDVWAGENPHVCVRASAYWSDGHTLETSNCAEIRVTAEATS